MALEAWKWPGAVYDTETDRRFRHLDDNDKVVKAYDASKWLAVIIAHNHLRESAQREEELNKRMQEEREKANDPYNKNAKAKVEQLENEIKVLRRRIWLQEEALHRAEWSLDDDLRCNYSAVRKYPTWFLNGTLIGDCASRGGCCARECGCCEKRASSPQRKKGYGHCTVECGCCIRHRGVELNEAEKEQNRKDFENLLWGTDPVYALEMGLGYFWDVIIYKDKAPEDTEPKPEDTMSNSEDPKSKPEDKPSEDTKSNPPTPPASRSSTSKDPPPPYIAPGDTVAKLPPKEPVSKSQQVLQQVLQWL